MSRVHCLHIILDQFLDLLSTSLCQAWLNYHVNIMTMTRYGSPGRAQSNLKNIFNRITAFHMSLVQVSRQNTEETETEMFWKKEAALFNAFNAMLSIFMIFWVKFLSNVKNSIFNKSLRLFELMVEWIDKRWTSIEFESQTFPPRQPLHQSLSELAGYNLGSAKKECESSDRKI